jgi:arsenate reductase (thioredoxin)
MYINDNIAEITKEEKVPKAMRKKIIYFLCTGNSCRSQMAEGFAKKMLGDRFQVYSAGLEAHGLNPGAVAVMKERGIDISNQTSEVIDPEILSRADYVITLCGDANDKCPVIPPSVRREHWDLDDPAKAKGTEEEVLAVFRRVRDEIEKRIRRFSEESGGG